MDQRQEGSASLAQAIERRIRQEAELEVIVQEEDDHIALNGVVGSEEERQAAGDIAAQIAADRPIENNLEVTEQWPYPLGEIAPDALEERGAIEAHTADIDAEPDFTSQPLETDPLGARGPSEAWDDTVGEGDAAYFAPTDPVIGLDDRGAAHVLGGFSASSMDDLAATRSAMDGRRGDEALAQAVRRELLEDAMTTSLFVDVEVRDGSVILRGEVPHLEDADAAEEVAGRVPGVVEVIDELVVAGV